VKPEIADEKTRPAAKQPSSEQPQPVPPSERTVGSGATEAQQYVVKGGDTLSKIAQQFYDSMSKWPKIYEANRDQVKNPNYIYIGMKLIIPPEDQAS
jgi:nucleoid-associated protein YgaU